MAKEKSASPSWAHVKSALLEFDRMGLLGLVHDLYGSSRDNQAFLHARLGLGRDQLKSYKTNISRWICPDLMRNKPISISKAKKAISDYRNAVGWPEGLAELSIFYCEEALTFLESCSMDDDSYNLALIRMYYRSSQLVLDLPPSARSAYLERLNQIRSRAKHVNGVLADELNSLWHEVAPDEPE